MLCGREHPKVVQEMLGHSRIDTSLDFYSHVQPDMQIGVAGPGLEPGTP